MQGDGHPAGDRMLREIAETMQQHFGQEHTYRIGGDEFVAFRIDGQPEELSLETDRLKQDLARKDYHISVGIAVGEKAKGELKMYGLVSEAEANMFADKRAFYLQAQNDRRSR
jgi:GGDEF domain-containing protein